MSCYVLDALIYFNSRPHKEVDQTQHSAIHSLITFQLTTSQGGRLSRVFSSWVCPHISTHDLTRRSTAICCAFTRADAFQLTTSQGGRPLSNHDVASALAFQLTTSQGGRHQVVVVVVRFMYFNSRPHKEVDRKHRLRRSVWEKFQLTTSQGGRLLNSDIIPPMLYFNSRPHKEVDRLMVLDAHSMTTFQLTTSQGGRQCLLMLEKGYQIFQLTTSQGGRPRKLTWIRADWIFQLTTSQGGRPCSR